ncbi:MAG TPA: YgjP-like metallopeptidase domain-containing protein [Candidatus Saccharimonadales bacterium]|nr:YgjP-like metallopeptidase domain-containing protein [Candidatus Saccharimonadales bacterium]
MSYKEFHVENIGTVKLYKRKGSRSLRLSVTAAGDIRATMPTWMPYASGLSFVNAQRSWILSQQTKQSTLLTDGQHIGKAHRLYFTTSATLTAPAARIRNSDIIVSYPAHMTAEQAEVQKKATEACIRALRLQANALLPQRLKALAEQHDTPYSRVAIKQLRSRWGSCDQNKNIVLNLFLMQLPWELIDYVLLHELTHTRVMRHGTPFWAEMQRLDPRSQHLRRAIREHRPILTAQPMP